MPSWFRWGDEESAEIPGSIYGPDLPPSVEPVSADPGFSWRDYGEAVLKRVTSYDLYEILVKEEEEEQAQASPNVFTRAKAEMGAKVSGVTSAISGTFLKYGLLILAVLLILAIGYGTTLYAIRKKVL